MSLAKCRFVPSILKALLSSLITRINRLSKISFWAYLPCIAASLIRWEAKEMRNVLPALMMYVYTQFVPHLFNFDSVTLMIWDKCCLFSKHTWDLTHRCNQSNEAIVTTVTRQRRKCDVRFLLLMMRWDRNRQEAFFVERKRTANGRAKGRVGKGNERRYGQSNATWNQQDINGQGDASSKLFWVFLSGKDQCYLYVWIIFFYAKAKKTINFLFRLLWYSSFEAKETADVFLGTACFKNYRGFLGLSAFFLLTIPSPAAAQHLPNNGKKDYTWTKLTSILDTIVVGISFFFHTPYWSKISDFGGKYELEFIHKLYHFRRRESSK